MSLVEMLAGIESLTRPDKLRLIQFLAQELAQAEDAPLLVSGGEYAVWSPQEAFGAADTLLQTLKDERGTGL